MLPVDGQVKHQDRQRDIEPQGPVQPAEQSPLTLVNQHGKPDGQDREGQAHQQGIDHDQCGVDTLAPRPAPIAARGPPVLYGQHQQQRGDKGQQSDFGFMLEQVHP